MSEPLIFEQGVPGRCAAHLPGLDVPASDPLPSHLLRDDLALPEVCEVDLVRHYTHLSQLNYGVDVGFYPLGSCTMKYNPKVHEDVARLPGFVASHPYQPVESVQGNLRLMYELQEFLKALSGFQSVSLQPAAGAHGELTGILMMRAYHEARAIPSAIRSSSRIRLMGRTPRRRAWSAIAWWSCNLTVEGTSTSRHYDATLTGGWWA